MAEASCAPRRQTLVWCRRRAPLMLATASIALVAAVVLAAGAGSGSSGDKVYFLNAMYSTVSFTVPHAQAVWLGMDAAFHNADYTAAGGRKIEIVSPSSSVNQSNTAAVVEAALADYPTLLGVLGPYGDANLEAGLASTAVQSAGLMFLAPFTGSSTVRTWNENTYFMRAEPRLEVMAIVQYIANEVRALRTAFMYLTGVDYGDAEYADYVSLMSSVGLDAPALYAVPYSTTSTAVNTTAFDAMADTYPQVVVLWGMPGEQTQNFLEAVLTDPRTSSAYIMSPLALQQEVFDVYYGLALAGTTTPVGGQVLSSSSVLPMSFPDSEHIPAFMAQMSRYMKETGNVNVSLWADEATYVAKYGSSYASASGSSSYADAFLHEHPSTAQLMLTGWIAGTLIMQTLGESNWFTDRATYQSYLFQQHRYIVGGDYVLGDYGGPCNTIALFLAAVCYCNQGGHAAFMEVLSNASWMLLRHTGVNYSASYCYSTDTVLPRPISFVTILPTDNSLLAAVSEEINTVIPAVIAYANYIAHPINMNYLNTTEANMQAALSEQVSNYSVDVVMGTLTDNLDSGSYLVPAPVFTMPHLVSLTKNYVYLMPTLEQQFYLLYQNLATVQGVTSVGSSVQVVLHGYTSAEVANITKVLQKSAATFDYGNPTVAAVSASATVSSALVDETINVVIGVSINDVSVIADFLAAHTTAIVVVCFDDLSTLYQPLVSAFSSQAASVQARLLSFTNLPLWSDTSAAAEAASPLLSAFHGAFPSSVYHTPTSLRAVVVAGFVTALLNIISNSTGASLVTLLYQQGAVPVYGTNFGTFTWSCTATTSSSVCTYVNYGAQSIVMLSMERMLNSSVSALTTASTPSMVYSARRASGLTTAQRNGVIACTVVGGVLLIAAVALLVYCCSDSRDNAAAPKAEDDPVTLIFTDIESSTAMWAALPQLMAEAIAAHHRVIRQLIKKHGCYEVKTIGDSFMIACKDAYSAVKLVCDIQRKLLEYDWGTTEIDSTYREFELARVDSVEGYVPTTARLSEEEYAALWRGLRVRIGLHTGLSDIRYDEVTKGYDYYGDTSNMAARTEAIANGGQVVATETTWWALSRVERDAMAHTAMGPQGLRGVPYAVEMYQLNPVPGRTHAALRTEVEIALPDDNAADTASNGADALLSSAGTMTGAAAGVAFVITSCFSPYPPAQRVRELQPLLAKWNIGAPPRSKSVSEEDYCQGLINRLAIRIASVTEARQAAGVTQQLSGFYTRQGTEDSSRNPLRPPSGSPLVSSASRTVVVGGSKLRRAVTELPPQVPSPVKVGREDLPAGVVRGDDEVVPFVREDTIPVSPASGRDAGVTFPAGGAVSRASSPRSAVPVPQGDVLTSDFNAEAPLESAAE